MGKRTRSPSQDDQDENKRLRADAADHVALPVNQTPANAAPSTESTRNAPFQQTSHQSDKRSFTEPAYQTDRGLPAGRELRAHETLNGMTAGQILDYLIDNYGSKYYEYARGDLGRRMTDRVEGRKRNAKGPHWRKHWNRGEPRRKRDSGKFIYTPIALIQGDGRELDWHCCWWLRGAEGMVIIFKIVPALVVYNGKHFSMLKVLTTMHNTDVEKMESEGRLDDMVLCTVTTEINVPNVKGSAGRLWIKDGGQGFRWSDCPRFFDIGQSYFLPHCVSREEIAELAFSGDYELVTKLNEAALEKHNSHLKESGDKLASKEKSLRDESAHTGESYWNPYPAPEISTKKTGDTTIARGLFQGLGMQSTVTLQYLLEQKALLPDHAKILDDFAADGGQEFGAEGFDESLRR